nr:hypothetical protein [Saccharomonospora azurea]
MASLLDLERVELGAQEVFLGVLGQRDTLERFLGDDHGVPVAGGHTGDELGAPVAALLLVVGQLGTACGEESGVGVGL